MPDEQESRPEGKSGETEQAGTEEGTSDSAPTITDEPSADEGHNDEPRRLRRIVRPTEALDRLDRQWEDRRPLRHPGSSASIAPRSSVHITLPREYGDLFDRHVRSIEAQPMRRRALDLTAAA